jgi:hypothetical protein
MSGDFRRRRAHPTKTDVVRAIRAAKQEGASAVEVRPDGTLVIRLEPLNHESLESETPEDSIVL